MLVTNYHNNVVTVKLLSGQEIVGRCTGVTETTISLSRPVMMGLVKVSEDQLAIQMQDHDISSGETVEFELKNVMSRSVTREQVAQQYIKSTSPLVAEQKSSLIMP